jgi:SCY1-like protein 2
MKSIRFLDAFPEKTASERQSFMKGLLGIIPQFPPRVLTKKILPGIMDQFKDTALLPLILPNVFLIAEGMTPKVFSEAVLPRLKELFSLKESPGALAFLLDKIPFLKTKITAYELKEDAMVVVYTALAGDAQYLQEKALTVSAEILQDLDLVTIKTALFPKVADVFSHTTMLGTKVTALETFDAMVQHNLDKYTITEKLLPLIKQMKTKEPAVSMAALKLSKSCGSRIDHENIALDLLPQLWTMALGPLLSQSQFKQFMSVIKSLSERVEQEQVKKLTDSGAPVGLPSSQGSSQGQAWSSTNGPQEEVSFEALVAGNTKPASNGFMTGQATGMSPALAAKPAAVPAFDWSTPALQPSSKPPVSQIARGSSYTGGVLAPTTGQTTPAASNYATTTSYGQPSNVQASRPNYNIDTSSIDWSKAASKPAQSLSSYGPTQPQTNTAAFDWSTPATSQQPFTLAPPPSSTQVSSGQQGKTKPANGLSSYQSLL